VPAAPGSHAERVAAFLEDACLNYGVRPGTATWDPGYPDGPARRRRAARVLARHPEIARDGIHTAVVCGDLVEVRRILAERPQAASEKGGPQRWEPLLFVCFARLPVTAAGDDAVAIARLLLDHGADPNASFTDGENRFTPLTGAMGEGERPLAAVPPHPAARALVALLLERGADAHDRQGLYNTSLGADDDCWLEVLLTRTAGGEETLDYLLGNAVVRGHARRVGWLLAHGARATARNRYSKRGLHEEALLRGLTEMAALLLRHGAAPADLQGGDAFQAACMRLDRDAARGMLEAHPEYLQHLGPMLAAAELDRADVAALLLDLGMSPDVEDRERPEHRPLHAAAAADARGVAALLLERGAEVDARDHTHGGTPLGWAVYLDKPRLVELLSRVSRDVFSLAAAGRVEDLRRVLEAEPALAKAMHGGLTPLFHLPEDDARAVAIVDMLCAHGADAALRDGEGRTAADRASERDLEAAAERLRRSPPRE
jgi:ankyrin repeat protein